MKIKIGIPGKQINFEGELVDTKLYIKTDEPSCGAGHEEYVEVGDMCLEVDLENGTVEVLWCHD